MQGWRVGRRPQAGALIACDEVQAHVREDGPVDGPVVVLLHGFASSIHTFDQLTPLLADTCRVVRVDLLGHGCTVANGALDAEAQGRMVASVLASLDLRDVTVLGHSFGADVALAAARQSDRAARVVIVAQAPDYSYARIPRAGAVMTMPVVGPVLHRLTVPPLFRLLGKSAFAPGFDPDSVPGEGLRAYRDHAAMSPAMYRTLLVDRRDRLAANPLDAQVRELGLPALVVVGRHDRMYDAERTVARYEAAGAETAVVDDAGHSPTIEQPAETARLVRGFVTA